jgi:hypothetical protein
LVHLLPNAECLNEHLFRSLTKARRIIERWLKIPIYSGQGFRLEAGRRSDLIPAAIPM